MTRILLSVLAVACSADEPKAGPSNIGTFSSSYDALALPDEGPAPTDTAPPKPKPDVITDVITIDTGPVDPSCSVPCIGDKYCLDGLCRPCECLFRECGTDPCGTSCGDCASGRLCNQGQRCVTPSDTCAGRCLEPGDGVRCGCDAGCTSRGDCCADACHHCDLPSCDCSCESKSCGQPSGCGFNCQTECPAGTWCDPATGCQPT